jgi:hypothetical protein
MRIAKPILLVTTPIGVAGAIYEAFNLAGGLGFLMVALILMISAAIGMLVSTIRKEERAALAAKVSARGENS